MKYSYRHILEKFCFFLTFLICSGFLIGCKSEPTSTTVDKRPSYSDVQVVGAMKNVMWKGELQGKIELDTISNKSGLYGIGPVSGLQGEILIKDGHCFISKVGNNDEMIVEKTFQTSAPFFVYAHVNKWEELQLPSDVRSIDDLQDFFEKASSEMKLPFVFKLKAKIDNASIHVQNLPNGTTVSSPKEAHQGQVNYLLSDEDVEIVGFFSKEHQGIFTHHDTYLHMHLITVDQNKMGHLDEITFEKATLYLPID